MSFSIHFASIKNGSLLARRRDSTWKVRGVNLSPAGLCYADNVHVLYALQNYAGHAVARLVEALCY